jgi:bifunctional DNA-binding transcriptional regulator/antitoxin component of YhaV-PrlF toxin-antitoxin module
MLTKSYNGQHLAYYDLVGDTKAKVTRNGQISLPAELRHRWQSSAVLVIDRGSYAIVRPVPDDVVTVLRGRHAGPGPTSEEARAAERARDQETAARRRPTA